MPGAKSPKASPASSALNSLLGSSGKKATVVSFEAASGAPQDEQKLTPVGFLWPHARQNTALTVATYGALCSRDFLAGKLNHDLSLTSPIASLAQGVGGREKLLRRPSHLVEPRRGIPSPARSPDLLDYERPRHRRLRHRCG